MHLIESGPYRFLLDCGLHRGPGEDIRRRNRFFSFNPATIDALFLSHAHLDHCGNIPNLIRQGFVGPIFCTHATRDLIAVMLEDSERIQMNRIQMNTAPYSRSRQVGGIKPDTPGETTSSSVKQAIAACVGVDFQSNVQVNPDVQIRFIEAGHILGSAIIVVKLIHVGREFTITFSGDLGRRGLPYLCDPSPLPSADLIICESTYGGRTHDTVEQMSEKMAGFVEQTLDRGGKVLIPAFSLGRTQLVLHYLRNWMKRGIMPRMPIYIDSPLAKKIATIHQQYGSFLVPEDEEVTCEWIDDEEDAMYRSTQRDPCIILASGGMCEGGRIVSHLRTHIDDPRSSIVLVSYQASDSLGAQLLSRVSTVHFQRRRWNKWINVGEIKGFSGHADENDFQWLLADAAQATRHVRLVHGEPKQMTALAKQMRQMGFSDVESPSENQSVLL